MFRNFLLAFWFLLFLSSSSSAADQLDDHPVPVLQSSKNSDGTVSVVIVGPPDLISTLSRCQVGDIGRDGPGGNGLTIRWGDGTGIDYSFGGLSEGADCSHLQSSHVYSVPGSYMVEVSQWGRSDTGAQPLLWASAATVTVDAKPQSDTISLPSSDKTEYRYGENVRLSWTSTLAAPATLDLFLKTSDGEVMESDTGMPWAVNGNGSALIRLSSDAYQRALKRGVPQFHVEAVLRRNGKTVSKVSGPDIAMSPEYPERLAGFSVVSSGRDMNATASFYVTFPNCTEFDLDWGDGSRTRQSASVDSRGCLLSRSKVSFIHTYEKPGYYSVKYKTNDMQPSEPLSSMLNYYGATVSVGSKSP